MRIDGLGDFFRAGFSGIGRLAGNVISGIANFMKSPMSHLSRDEAAASRSVPVAHPAERIEEALRVGGWAPQQELASDVKDAVNAILEAVDVGAIEGKREEIDFTTELNFEGALPIMKEFIEGSDPGSIASAAIALAKADPRIGAQLLDQMPDDKEQMQAVARQLINQLGNDYETGASLIKESLLLTLRKEKTGGNQPIRGASMGNSLCTEFVKVQLGPSFREGLIAIRLKVPSKAPGAKRTEKLTREVLDFTKQVLRSTSSHPAFEAFKGIVETVEKEVSSHPDWGPETGKKVATNLLILRFVNASFSQFAPLGENDGYTQDKINAAGKTVCKVIQSLCNETTLRDESQEAIRQKLIREGELKQIRSLMGIN